MALTVNKFVIISLLKYLELAQGHIKGTLLASQAEVFFHYDSAFFPERMTLSEYKEPKER